MAAAEAAPRRSLWKLQGAQRKLTLFLGTECAAAHGCRPWRLCAASMRSSAGLEEVNVYKCQSVRTSLRQAGRLLDRSHVYTEAAATEDGSCDLTCERRRQPGPCLPSAVKGRSARDERAHERKPSSQSLNLRLRHGRARRVRGVSGPRRGAAYTGGTNQPCEAAAGAAVEQIRSGDAPMGRQTARRRGCSCDAHTCKVRSMKNSKQLGVISPCCLNQIAHPHLDAHCYVLTKGLYGGETPISTTRRLWFTKQSSGGRNTAQIAS